MERKGLNVYSYPFVILFMYIPVNIMAGMYFSDTPRYYGSYPRYEIILYYGVSLLFLYFIARIIDLILKERYTKVVFILTDILTLLALPLLTIATYFVSPH